MKHNGSIFWKYGKYTYKRDYFNGKRWGKNAIWESYWREGETGIHCCDKAGKTCMRYASDLSIKVTKKKKKLNKYDRDYFRGIADGMLDGYDEIFYNG